MFLSCVSTLILKTVDTPVVLPCTAAESLNESDGSAGFGAV